MRRFLIALVPFFCLAAGWNKSYFGATKPGSWAKYEDVISPNIKTTSTYTRLADENGAARIAIHTDSIAGSPAYTIEYTLKSGFALDRDLIDFSAAATSARSGPDGALVPIEPATMATMKQVDLPVGPNVVFKRTETIQGKSCDRYGYTLKRAGDKDTASIETGDIWLSDSVPFGVVKQTTTAKYTSSGKVKYESVRTLIASGRKDSRRRR